MKRRKIHVLPSSVASRIAAGEVIERPAAAVKELVENSLDAGSTFITIEIEDGGRRLIRVSDNGEGMTQEDALLACQRFATSKLISEDDVFRITTLGFRGEALPSMASISKFRLLTAVSDEPVGTEVTQTPHGGWQACEKPAVPGTQVELRDLFYNTPGRKKFLKAPATEFSHIGRVVQQAALAWPTVHFRLLHNGHVVYDIPAVSQSTDRFLQIYGPDFLEQCLPVEHDHEGLTVNGLVIHPHHARTSRIPQELFINRRPVRNATISHAIYEAYDTFLPKGRHPAFILFLEIEAGAIDVNVHPAKREVRFSHPDLVYRAVKAAVRQPLYARSPSQEIRPASQILVPRQASAFSSHSTSNAIAAAAQATIPFTTNDDHKGSHREGITVSLVKEAGQDYRLDAMPAVCNPLGQIHLTYLVIDMGHELHILDQHTAHERVLFERLWRTWQQRTIQTQELLVPEPIDVSPHQDAVLEAHLEDLAHMGIRIERFGPRAFVLRAVPALLGPTAYGPLIHGLLEDLEDWPALDVMEKKVRAVLATMACKSAVQAGRAMSKQEIVHLMADWVQEGRPMTCPHGRRIALQWTKEELDRVFARI